MSRNLGPILNPKSAEAMAISLGRKAFLRELFIAALLSLSLPMVSLAGIALYIHSSAVNLSVLGLGVVLVSAMIAIPLMFYASLRLNAATLARERSAASMPEQLIHNPFEGPFFFRREVVAGSVRSRIIGGFPVCIGFGLEIALMEYLTKSGVFPLLLVPIAAMLIAQTIIVAKLLR